MRKLNCMCELNRNIYVWIKSQIVNTKQNQIGFHMVPNDDPYGSSAVSVTDDHLFHLLILLHVHKSAFTHRPHRTTRRNKKPNVT